MPSHNFNSPGFISSIALNPPATRHVTYSYDRLSSYFGYLGSRAVSDEFEWVTVHHGGHYLVKKEELDDMRALADLAASDPESQTASVVPDPVVLSAIIRISPDRFRLIPCGSWKGPRRSAINFEDVKLSCLGIAPSHPVLLDDFRNVTNNLSDIMAKILTDGNVELPTDCRLPFRHTLFEHLDVPTSAVPGGECHT